MDTPNTTTRTKRCPRCGKELPLTEEYFTPTTHKPLGFRYECRRCRFAKSSKEKLPEGLKRCTKCKTVYPATTEHFHSECPSLR
jgi:hypothetical protein